MARLLFLYRFAFTVFIGTTCFFTLSRVRQYLLVQFYFCVCVYGGVSFALFVLSFSHRGSPNITRAAMNTSVQHQEKFLVGHDPWTMHTYCRCLNWNLDPSIINSPSNIPGLSSPSMHNHTQNLARNHSLYCYWQTSYYFFICCRSFVIIYFIHQLHL